MALFDQIGKKISDAGQSVAKQTKGLAETARLSSAISDNEKKIARICAELGKEYYKAHVKDPGAEQRELIDQITELLADNASKQEMIKKLKGMTKCPNCGADLPADAAFCTDCGFRMPASPSARVCARCGAEIPEGDSFCSSCGAPAE